MANDIVCENSKTGTPEGTWRITGDGDSSIQGFATDISVNQGGTISFKISTSASAYSLDIYRIGYYGGNGARKITSISSPVAKNQPSCLTNSSTHLYDCGNWTVSASWAVPSNATSGVYLAEMTRTDTGGQSIIPFIVRNDTSHSDVLYQTSDSSWQAYNAYGGNSLYGTVASIWDASNRAYKVSYNRPFNDIERITYVFGAEYPMIRWLESNGYDVTYSTDVDSDRNGPLIKNHKLYTSTGHDEYWSAGQRTNVEAARDAGINLAFFSGNEVFWKTRFENSIDGSGTAYRTLVCYKETLALAKLDPLDPPTWTGTWRDPTFSPPADGNRPENSLTGTIFMVNGPASDNNGLSIKVPSADGKMRFWRNTSIANLSAGSTATLPQGTLGYEWDVDADNGARPAGTFQLSTTTQTLTSSLLLDYGGVYGGGTATHHMTLHRAASGALVFGAGTVQWSWGLDSDHENTFGFANPAPSTDMQQATVNLFADMSIQPATIQSGVLLASKSTDATPPVSTITSPVSGATVPVNTQITISGTASDAGGGVVGGVEVSVDGGQTWHPASGRASWTYPFKPTQAGSYTLKSRAADDSGNIEAPGPGVTVSTGGVTTFSITGTISPSAAGASATVTLGGTSSATVTANSSGVYTFSGLLNGSYTVTPSKSGYIFSPVSTAVTINNATVSGVNFTGSSSSGTTYSISGSVIPSTSGSGVTIALTGTATASTVTDASGNFSFGSLVSGTYTITPSKLNFAFSPTQTVVTVVSANISGISFTATATAQTLLTTQTPSTLNDSDGPTTNYELGTVFSSSASGQITAIRFWKAASESGTHTGRIWSSAGTQLGSVAFTGETASGWQQQALTTPITIAANTTYVVTVNTANSYYVDTVSGFVSQVVNGSLSSIVGNNGLYGSVGQFPTGSYQSSNYFRDVVFVPGVTYSISGTITPVVSGTTVALTGTASASTTVDGSGNYTFAGLVNGSYTLTPAKTGYTFTPTSLPETVSGASITGANFTETAIPTYSISGTITPVVSGTTVALTGTASASTTVDGSGNYTFTGLANGSYTLTPAKTGYTFSPTSLLETVSGASITSVNFTETAIPTYSISGAITPVVSGTTVALTGTASASTTVDGSGNYTFAGLVNGSYTVTPAKTGYTFSPTSLLEPVSGASITGVNFIETAVPTYTISGNVSANGNGATVTLSGAASATTTADGSGNYTFTGLANGGYTVTPGKSGFTFTPLNQAVTINSANMTANFTAAASTGITIDATATGDRTSPAKTVVTAAFSTTAGNELLLAMVGTDVSSASGTNNSVSSVAGGGLTWVLVRRTNTQRGTAEIWRAFATAPLTNVTVTATYALSNVSSITVMSFKGVNTTGTSGSGAIGATGSGNGTTGSPTASLVTTAANSLVIGVAEDWNAAPTVTAGASQTLIHLLPLSGLNTFWMQRQNATTPASGTTVAINDTAPVNDMYNMTICEIIAGP